MIFPKLHRPATRLCLLLADLSPGLSTQLKSSYTRVILPFEEYEAKNAAKEKHSPPKKAATATNGTNGTNGDDKRARSVSAKLMDISPPDSPLTSTSSPLSEPPEDGENKANGTKAARPRRSTRMGSHDQGPFFHPQVFFLVLTSSRFENSRPEHADSVSDPSTGFP
jgi:hypothetical protein